MGDVMIERLARLSITEKKSLETELGIPTRPAIGKLGKPIKLCANYLEVTGLPAGDIVQYDLTIEPEVPQGKRRELFGELERQFSQGEFGKKLIAYDGMANLYSLGSLPKESYELAVQQPGRRPGEVRLFKFKIRKVSVVNLATLKNFLDGRLNYTPYEILGALEVILRHPLCQDPRNLILGRSIYDGKQVVQISGALDVWKGFFLSLRPSKGRLLLNVDTTMAALTAAGDVIPIVRDFLGISKNERLESLRPEEKGLVEKFLRGCRVEVTHRGEAKRKYKVTGLTATGADETYFTDQTESKISVAKYFTAAYKMNLNYKKLPCLVIGSKNRTPIFLPMECCRILPGQKHLGKLDKDQTTEMIRIANQKPEERKSGINKVKSFLNDHSKSLSGDFKFQFGTELIGVNGRILPPPKVFYGDKSREPEVIPRHGAWNLRDKTLEVASRLNSWAVLVFGRCNEAEVRTFIKELVSTAESSGLVIGMERPPILFATNKVQVSLEMAFSKAREASPPTSSSSSKPQLILCILPNDDSKLYGTIKRCTDTTMGLPSQCMLMKHIRRPSRQYCANLCLKINSKLGGVNSSLGQQIGFVQEQPTLILGADVTHPDLRDSAEESPSIAALVGSLDVKLGRYGTSVRSQKSKVEIISDMKSMFKEQLQQYQNVNRVRPQRILYYRDGVSEGQFSQVLDYELKAMKAGCQEVDPKYDPKITVILVQKRHHTRFFPVKQADADPSGNIPAGTIVDTGVVHPTGFDFFLCSHGGIQGTSRPAHYHVVHDENNFTADHMQTLSYQLCHTFARATRSVSLVTPVYYAHLVAFRARYHLADAGCTARGEFILPKVKPELASGMYFI